MGDALAQSLPILVLLHPTLNPTEASPLTLTMSPVLLPMLIYSKVSCLSSFKMDCFKWTGRVGKPRRREPVVTFVLGHSRWKEGWPLP